MNWLHGILMMSGVLLATGALYIWVTVIYWISHGATWGLVITLLPVVILGVVLFAWGAGRHNH